MEIEYVGKRAHLFHLLHQHPEWTLQQYADAVGCSKSMVSTWRQRFREAEAQGHLSASIFFSCSRAPHHRPPRIDEEVKARVQEIRLDPPEHVARARLGRLPSCTTCIEITTCWQKAHAFLVQHAPSGVSWMRLDSLSEILCVNALLASFQIL